MHPLLATPSSAVVIHGNIIGKCAMDMHIGLHLIGILRDAFGDEGVVMLTVVSFVWTHSLAAAFIAVFTITFISFRIYFVDNVSNAIVSNVASCKKVPTGMKISRNLPLPLSLAFPASS